MSIEVEELLAMTASPGWKLLIEDAERIVDSKTYELTTAAYDAYSFGKVQGVLQTYRFLINLRTVLQNQLAEQDSE